MACQCNCNCGNDGVAVMSCGGPCAIGGRTFIVHVRYGRWSDWKTPDGQWRSVIPPPAIINADLEDSVSYVDSCDLLGALPAIQPPELGGTNWEVVESWWHHNENESLVRETPDGVWQHSNTGVPGGIGVEDQHCYVPQSYIGFSIDNESNNGSYMEVAKAIAYTGLNGALVKYQGGMTGYFHVRETEYYDLPGGGYTTHLTQLGCELFSSSDYAIVPIPSQSFDSSAILAYSSPGYLNRIQRIIPADCDSPPP
jgi:hypothetical protein